MMNHKKIALLFSGQGAQTVGMGAGLTNLSPEVAALYTLADETLGYKLSDLMANGPESDLTQTRHCQPALYLHGLACLLALKQRLPSLQPVAAAGLSLGEFTAHAAAGTFDFATGLQLVSKRGTFMQTACDETEGGMSAAIGADDSAVESLAADCDVDVANYNSPGQIVLSGPKDRLATAAAKAKEKGIRLFKPLNVAGAYHSRLMASAADKLASVLTGTTISAPTLTVVSNVTAKPVSAEDEIRHTLTAQVTGSVRWTQSIRHLIDHEKIELFIELGPGGVLTGLLGRIEKGFPIVSIHDPQSLETALPTLSAYL
jgi:[acyl-carrier-protein] S-malonyltransferase